MAIPDNTPFLAALMPRDRWAVRSAQKDQELMYQQVLQQQSAMNLQQTQQQVAAMQQAQAELYKLPFMGRDNMAKTQWLNQKFSDLAKKIEKDYGNNPEKFLETEAPFIIKEIQNEFLASPIYKRGIQNLNNYTLAQSALSKGEYIVGGRDANGAYRSGRQMLADYINGNADTFVFGGSYKEPPLRDMIEYFGKQDNPYNKYDRNARVPRSEIENYIRSSATPEIAEDLIARGYADVPISYKRYSIQDEQNYNADLALKDMRYRTGQQQMGLNQQRSILNQQKIAENAKELQADSASGGTWFSEYRGTKPAPIKEVFRPVQGENYNIASLNANLKDFAPNGQIELTRRDVLTNTGKTYVRNKAGIGAKGGTAQDVIIPKNGGHVVNLSDVPHMVTEVDGNIYLPNGDIMNARGDRRTGHGFTKATIRIPKSAADAKGLYNENWWIIPDTDTEKGRGILMEDKKTGDFILKDVYLPLYGIYNDAEFNRLMLKGSMGQKRANELSDADSGGVDINEMDI